MRNITTNPRSADIVVREVPSQLVAGVRGVLTDDWIKSFTGKSKAGKLL